MSSDPTQGGILLGGPRQSLQSLDQRRQEEHDRRDKIGRLPLNRRDAWFRICRLRSRTPQYKITEFDGFDKCRGCGREVVYDRKDSEGLVHVCTDCVQRSVESFRNLSALNATPISNEKLSDPDQLARIRVAVAQNLAGENARDRSSDSRQVARGGPHRK